MKEVQHVFRYRMGGPSFWVLLILFIGLLVLPSFSQELQRNAFSFLNLSPAARVNGMGGVNISLSDVDLNSFLTNPATVSDSLSGVASVSHQFHVADIGYTSLAYGDNIGRVGFLAFGVQHFSYGDFQGYDPTGASTGAFRGAETALVVSGSHQVRFFRLGLSLKGVFGSLGGYRASALVGDIGAVFVHPDGHLQIGLVLRNAGVMLSDYTESSDSALPIDLQVGATIKPEHMPLRFSLAISRLINSSSVAYTGTEPTSPSTLQQVLRHFNFGAEVLLHRNVNLLAGYNWGVHQELKLESGGGSAGISYGFSIKVKSFELVFSRRTYVSATAGYAFSLSTDLDRFLSRQ